MAARPIGTTAASLARLLAQNPAEVQLTNGTTIIAGSPTANGLLWNNGGLLTVGPALTDAVGGLRGAGILSTGGGNIGWLGATTLAGAGTDGVLVVRNSGNTLGISLDVTTDAVAKFRNRANNADAAITAGALTTSAAVADTGYNYQVPTTGFTITMANGNYHLILDPAGTLASGTITMCAAPVDGQCVDIKISQIITALTVAGNSGQSVKGNPTSAAVGSSFTGIYRATNTTWYF